MSRRAWFLFAGMAIIWGIPYLLIRVAVRELDPGVLVLGRTAPAALLLLPLVIARDQFRVLLHNIKWIAAFGVIEFGIPWYLMSVSEQHLTSSLTSLIICGVPLLSVIAQRFRQTEEPVTRRRLLGLAIGGLGVLLLVGLEIRGGSGPYIGYMLLVACGYTLGPIMFATKLAHVPGTTVVAGAASIVAICWLPWAIAHWPTHIGRETWESVAVLSVVCTAGAFMVFFELVKAIGSTRSVVVTYVNTAIAVALGITILHEPLTVGIGLGFPLVLVGSIIATSQRDSAISGQLDVARDANLTINHEPER